MSVMVDLSIAMRRDVRYLMAIGMNTNRRAMSIADGAALGVHLLSILVVMRDVTIGVEVRRPTMGMLDDDFAVRLAIGADRLMPGRVTIEAAMREMRFAIRLFGAAVFVGDDLALRFRAGFGRASAARGGMTRLAAVRLL
jgi:hypothetical protein